MLVLSRKSNQNVVVGQNADIIVKVLDCHDGCVRLGFDAPKEIPVHREEVHQRILEEQEKSKEEEKDKVQ